MNEKTNSNQFQHDSNANSVPNKQPKTDTHTICSRMEQGIPFQLAQGVPAGMEIIKNGRLQDTNEPLYLIRRNLAYGTAEDIIDFLVETLYNWGFGFSANISEVGEDLDDPRYILRENIYIGTEEDIIDYFGC